MVYLLICLAKKLYFKYFCWEKISKIILCFAKYLEIFKLAQICPCVIVNVIDYDTVISEFEL